MEAFQQKPTSLSSLVSWFARRSTIFIGRVYLALVCFFLLGNLVHDIVFPGPSHSILASLVNVHTLSIMSSEESTTLMYDESRPKCYGREKVLSRDIWDAAQEKYRDLIDDKFT